MNLPQGLVLSVEDDPAQDDLDRLPHALEAFNEQRWPGHLPWLPLGVFLRQDSIVQAGLEGETYAGWLFVRTFWIAELLRGQGLGRRMLQEAERRATLRGCHSAWLDTFSFQAPGFYERMGYAVFGTLPYPPHERLFLQKRLS